MSLKILAIVHGFGPRHSAGAEHMLRDIFRYLTSKGHTCQVLTTQPMCPIGEETYVYESIKVTSLDKPGAVDILMKWCDVCFTHLDMTSRVIGWAQEYKKPLLHLIHNPNTLSHWEVRPSDVAVAVFNSYSQLNAHKGIPVKSTVQFPPVFLEDYDLQRTSRIKKEDKRYISLLNMNENKGGGLFWKLARLAPERWFLGCKGCYDVQINGALPNVLLHPHTGDTVKDIYSKTDILLVPSASETWGRVAVEAACSGIPVIANPTPGLREAMGDSAIWCDRDQPQQWIDAINKLDNESEYQLWSDKARQRAKILEIETILQLESLERILYQIISNDGRKIHFLAQQKHYADHLLPIYHSIPPTNRGIFIVPKELNDYCASHGALTLASDVPSQKQALHTFGLTNASVALCASYYDQRLFEDTLPISRIEHGAGQTYQGKPLSSYAGSDDHKRLSSYFATGEHTYQANDKVCPTFLAGCPKLDLYHKYEQLFLLPESSFAERMKNKKKPTITFSFHWNGGSDHPESIETYSYWKIYVRSFIETHKEQYNIYGHCHPHCKDILKPFFDSLNVEFIDSFHEVAILSDIYVCDNSSTIFEFAALGKAVVLLNHPRYRKNIEHGLRFWEHADIGVQVNSPEALTNQINKAVAYTLKNRQKIKDKIEKIYHQSITGASKTVCDLLLTSIQTPPVIKYIAKHYIAARTFMNGNRMFYVGQPVNLPEHICADLKHFLIEVNHRFRVDLPYVKTSYKECSLLCNKELDIQEQIKLILITQMEK